MEFKITDDEKMKLKKIHKTLKDKRSADKIKDTSKNLIFKLYTRKKSAKSGAY